jgi:hypothetical protein
MEKMKTKTGLFINCMDFVVVRTKINKKNRNFFLLCLGLGFTSVDSSPTTLQRMIFWSQRKKTLQQNFFLIFYYSSRFLTRLRNQCHSKNAIIFFYEI